MVYLHVPSKQSFIIIVLKQIFKPRKFNIFKNWKYILKSKKFSIYEWIENLFIISIKTFTLSSEIVMPFLMCCACKIIAYNTYTSNAFNIASTFN